MRVSTAGERYRLVTDQDGHENVSSVVYGAAEIGEQLEIEAMMHEGGGWLVTRLQGGILCVSPNGVMRRIYPARFDPFSDEGAS